MPASSEAIRAGKFVELTYRVTDRKTGHVLTRVEFPLGYVHGHNEILAPSVHMQLEGKSAGDTIEVVIDGNQIFGARDESLVFSDRIENVPEEYRQVGTSILMENERGQTRSLAEAGKGLRRGACWRRPAIGSGRKRRHEQGHNAVIEGAARWWSWPSPWPSPWR